MYHQWRLARCSIDTSKVDWMKIEEDAKRRFLEDTGLAKLPPFLDLLRARMLDRIQNGDVPEDDAMLRDLLQKRNHSILAHGLEPIGEKPARRFLEYVDAMVGEEKARMGATHLTLRGL
jgi:hypothetical protein